MDLSYNYEYVCVPWQREIFRCFPRRAIKSTPEMFKASVEASESDRSPQTAQPEFRY